MCGPMPPLRGGVPKHTARLADALQKKTKLTVLSPKNLYPSVLFPGASQIDKTQIGYQREGSAFVTYGSTLRLLFKLATLPRGQECLIVWWTTGRALQTYLITKVLNHRRHKIVFFCHNVFPHDASGLARKISSGLLSRASSLMVQSDEQADLLARVLPNANVSVVSHPAWVSPMGSDQHAKRSNVLLFFGLIRPYKGLPTLLSALDDLDPTEDVCIKVVGEVWDKKLEAQLLKHSARDPRLEFTPGFTTDSTMDNLFASARAILMPYIHATGSGILASAKQHRKPVIASRISPFTEEVQEGVDGVLFEPENAGSLASAIKRVLEDPELCSEAWSHGQNSDYSWDDLADAVRSSFMT